MERNELNDLKAFEGIFETAGLAIPPFSNMKTLDKIAIELSGTVGASEERIGEILAEVYTLTSFCHGIKSLSKCADC